MLQNDARRCNQSAGNGRVLLATDGADDTDGCKSKKIRVIRAIRGQKLGSLETRWDDISRQECLPHWQTRMSAPQSSGGDTDRRTSTPKCEKCETVASPGKMPEARKLW